MMLDLPREMTTLPPPVRPLILASSALGSIGVDRPAGRRRGGGGSCPWRWWPSCPSSRTSPGRRSPRPCGPRRRTRRRPRSGSAGRRLSTPALAASRVSPCERLATALRPTRARRACALGLQLLRAGLAQGRRTQRVVGRHHQRRLGHGAEFVGHDLGDAQRLAERGSPEAAMPRAGQGQAGGQRPNGWKRIAKTPIAPRPPRRQGYDLDAHTARVGANLETRGRRRRGPREPASAPWWMKLSSSSSVRPPTVIALSATLNTQGSRGPEKSRKSMT